MNTKKYFSTSNFSEGLCQLNFDSDIDNNIELLMSAENWEFISSETTQIGSVDIESHDNKVVVSFVDSLANKPHVMRTDNPYSLTVSVDQTNLIPHVDSEKNAIVFDTNDLATRTHTLMVYIENSEEPVAEFKNVKAFRNDKKITKIHVDRYISG